MEDHGNLETNCMLREMGIIVPLVTLNGTLIYYSPFKQIYAMNINFIYLVMESNKF